MRRNYNCNCLFIHSLSSFSINKKKIKTFQLIKYFLNNKNKIEWKYFFHTKKNVFLKIVFNKFSGHNLHKSSTNDLEEKSNFEAKS